MLMQQQVSFIEKKNEPLPETSKNVTPEKTAAPQPPKPPTQAEKLQELEEGVIIQQKWELMDSLSCCEFPITYKIYSKDHRGNKKGKSIFKYKDKSSHCGSCQTLSCKPFNIKAYPQFMTPADNQRSCLRLEKRCKCTYYCCNRGEVVCYRNDDSKAGEEPIGSIFDMFDCGNYSFKLQTLEEGSEAYIVKTGCCQTYLWCKCPCGACPKIVFEILRNGVPSGEIIKRGRKGCVKPGTEEFLTVDFPRGTSWAQRALLMGCGVFQDWGMFEDSKTEK